jgi:hypothetical protein
LENLTAAPFFDSCYGPFQVLALSTAR